MDNLQENTLTHKVAQRILDITHVYGRKILRLQAKTGICNIRRNWQHRQLRRKKSISIVFPIDTFSKWKADSLLRLLLKHPRFTPVIRLVNVYEPGSKEDELNRRLIQEYAASLGVPCLSFTSYNALPQGYRADLVILSEAYDGFILFQERNKGLFKRPFCYIPYGFYSIGNKANLNSIANNFALFNFYENESSRQLATSLMDNGGANISITGHAMADAFLFSPDRFSPAWKNCGKPMKKIIWAPHWTIAEETSSWFTAGNFLEVAEQMTELAERYQDEIQFAFKPHPLLHRALCQHPKWGKEKTDAFYRRWAEMPNTQLEEGAYAGLFMQSDACIHDCGSFIVEYMFADKPALFLVRGEGYQGYSNMAQEGLKCYIKGQSKADIEPFLHAVLRGEDPLREQRRTFRAHFIIPPHEQSAAQNIVDCLLGEGAYAKTPQR